MIVIRDNFLPDYLFSTLQKYCQQEEFKVVASGGKEFLIVPTPPELLPHIQIENCQLILSFIRKAHKDFDVENRIHADNIINGHYVDYAIVIYINNPKNVTRNGTCFWEHLHYKERLDKDVTPEEYDRLITEDSNDDTKWNRTDIIYAKPNRMIMYDAQLFHSKFPSKIETGERIVLVAFFKKTN